MTILERYWTRLDKALLLTVAVSAVAHANHESSYGAREQPTRLADEPRVRTIGCEGAQ